MTEFGYGSLLTLVAVICVSMAITQCGRDNTQEILKGKAIYIEDIEYRCKEVKP